MSKVYEYVTDRFVKMMENGVCPWKQTWTMTAAHNYSSGHKYSGINAFLLSMAPYKDPRFITINQLGKLGGKVKKGEKSWMVILWKIGEKDDVKPDGSVKKKKTFLLTYYNVFNVEQTEGWEPKPLANAKANNPIEACDAFMKALPEQPKMGVGNPSYVPSLDEIRMPELNQFNSSEHYYSVLFHELTHWTGGKTRLNRIESTSFGSEKYAKEELVAELGAAFLANKTGIATKTEENAAAYLSHWLKVLKADPKLLVAAASQAQKAVDWMEGKTQPTEETPATESKAEMVAVS